MTQERKTKTRAVQIADGLHTALVALASKMTIGSADNGKRNSRVTIRGIVEAAVLAQHPELRLTADVATEPQSEAEPEQVSAELFSAIMAAIYNAADGNSDSAIDALEGSVVGTYGQKLRLRELAYHLRGGTFAPVGSLEELVKDFERAQ